jgi:type IV secretory pathway TrbD component
LFRQLAYLAVHADPGLTRATLHDWVPTFALSTDGLVFALCFGVAVWLLFQVLWWLLARAGQRLSGRRSPRLSGRRYA